MQAADLRQGRTNRGWSQAEAAARLRVSQSYLSRLEQGARPVPERLARRALGILQLPATARPLPAGHYEIPALSPAALAIQLAALGYPGLAYQKISRAPDNPAVVLLAALSHRHLEMRLVEALPWLVGRYPQMAWPWLVPAAKLHDCQNRLGFVVGLARELAEQAGATARAALLRLPEIALAHSRLAREDTLCHDDLAVAERAWLRSHRPAEAVFWNLLTDLTAAQLAYAV